jgi:hypothetical protein
VETRLVPDAPGAWLVYDLGTLVFAVPAECRATADAIAAASPSGVPAVIAALRASGVPGTPFAVIDATDGGVHVALRGTATLAAGTETLTGLGAEPWLERVIPDAAVVRLTVPGGEWTLSLAAAIPAGRTAATEVPHITEVPDLEISLPPAPPPLGLDDSAALDEHDGLTVLAGAGARVRDDDDRTVVVDEVAKLRARRNAGLAAPMPPASPVPPAPRLSLELPDGTREPLDAVVLVGRAPTAPADAPASRLVRLGGDGDISRNHARVAVEGGTVVVTDLGSRNGTTVRIPGRPPQQLRHGEPTPVLVGTVIDFGGGLELNVRDD